MPNGGDAIGNLPEAGTVCQQAVGDQENDNGLPVCRAVYLIFWFVLVIHYSSFINSTEFYHSVLMYVHILVYSSTHYSLLLVCNK